VAGGRIWRWSPLPRLAALQLLLAGVLAGAAAGAGSLPVVAALLLPAGMALGALFVTVYVLVAELAPAGARTRAFAWLVAANNGGVAVGAAGAGALIAAHTDSTGLWLAAGCALAGLTLALLALVLA
jgi:predicted MFS family arabinose efflux permease